MNEIPANLSALRALLCVAPVVKSKRDSRWLETPSHADGFLRLVIEEDDGKVEFYRFDRRTMLTWQLHLQLNLPAAVFMAAVRSMFVEAGVSLRD